MKINSELEKKIQNAVVFGLPQVEGKEKEDERFQVLKGCLVQYLTFLKEEEKTQVELSVAVKIVVDNTKGCNYDDYKALMAWAIIENIEATI